MLVQTSQGQSGSAHVVVLGNEKGGSGKSTTALHIAVALMKAGQREATIDLDCRQQSFTRYINNRQAWTRRTGLELEVRLHGGTRPGLRSHAPATKNSRLQRSWVPGTAVGGPLDFLWLIRPVMNSTLLRLG